MHYHSAHHGQTRLRRAARFQHGETQLPSSTPLPEQPAPLPSASAPASAASNFERMGAELKALQQQAQATQQSLAQLQSRKSADPYTAIASKLPSVPSADGTLLGVATVVVLAAAAAWVFFRARARNRWTEAAETYAQTGAPVSTHASLQSHSSHTGASRSWAPSTAAGELSTSGFESSSAHARLDRDIAFDSEAAATEVTRVRKSLAEKRVARANYLEREDAIDPSLYKDLDLDLDLDESHPPAAFVQEDSHVIHSPAPEALPEPAMDLESALDLDLDLDPWRQPGESLPGPADHPADDAIHFSLELDDYGIKPDAPTAPDAHTHYELSMDPLPAVEPEAEMEVAEEFAAVDAAQWPADFEPNAELGSKDYDYTITMALAQESAALELWTEARDLATEVLGSDDAALVGQARDLLARLNQLEEDAPPDTNWSTVR